MRQGRGRLRLVLAAGLVLAGGRVAAQDLPLFDAHIHYSEPSWATVEPRQALAIL